MRRHFVRSVFILRPFLFFFLLTQHRQIGDDAPEEGWVAVPNTSGLMKEVRENKVKSREETEELLETEDIQHLGDITDEVSFL